MAHSLYTDGSYYAHLNAAGIGGYLLDEKGNRVWEFSEQLSNDKILHQFEAYALEHGIRKCIESGVKELECFLDAKSLAETLNIKDQDKLRSYAQKDKSFKSLIPLLKEFDSINFFYLPRNENKLADRLSRRQLFKNIPVRTQIVADGFQLPNLFCTQQFNLKDKKQFFELKRDVNNHYLFNTIESKDGFTLEVYEMQKFPEIKVVSSKRMKLGDNWIADHMNILNHYLEKCPHEDIGIIFYPRSHDISKMIRGIKPMSKKFKKGSQKVMDVSQDFSKIVVHDDESFLKIALLAEFKEKQDIVPMTLEQKREMLIENLRILTQPDYQFGSNAKVEKFFALPPKKLENLVEIQKFYFSEILRLDMKMENEQRRLNKEVIERGSSAKDKILDRMAQLRQNLEERGIKIKM